MRRPPLFLRKFSLQPIQRLPHDGRKNALFAPNHKERNPNLGRKRPEAQIRLFAGRNDMLQTKAVALLFVSEKRRVVRQIVGSRDAQVALPSAKPIPQFAKSEPPA